LFPGYVFCQFDVMHRLPIISIPGFVGIVGCGKVPTSVDSAELDAIRSVVESGVLARPWPFLRVGHQVVLRRGPLAGLEGILLGFKSGQRVVLSITLLQRSVAVDVDADWVRPILYSLPDRTLPLKSYRPAV
jgi:transcription antitermination factor NusG